MRSCLLIARPLIALLPLLLAGCGSLNGLKLLSPEAHGLEQVAPNLYVELGADSDTRRQLELDMREAKAAVEAAYGSVISSPVVNVCRSESCYARFGGQGSRAKVYGGRLILISPRGTNWHYIAHEWSHAEMANRLTFPALLRLPQWFDEGVAVAVSAAPENSDAHWQFLIAAGVARPTRNELYSCKSLREWDQAVGRFGAKQNIERKARGEPEIRPLYTAAGHELRPWLATEGSAGLLHLIAQLNAGGDFDSLYVSRSDPATW